MSPDSLLDRREHTRAAIIEAAGRLMAAQGVRGTTIEQVAKEAYVSVGAIYAHFVSKIGLALYFVDLGLTDLERDVAKARDLASPLDRVGAAGDAWLRFAVEHPVAARFAAVRVLDPEPAPELAEANAECSHRMRPIVQGIAGDVREAMDAGLIPRASVGDTLAALWSLWSGATSLILRQDEFSISPEAGARIIEAGRARLLAA